MYSGKFTLNDGFSFQGRPFMIVEGVDTMELTLEQQSAVERGEAISVRVPHVKGECVIMLRDQYIDMQIRLQEEADLAAERAIMSKRLTPERLRRLVKNQPPEPSWYEEDHTGLFDVPTS